MFDLEMYCFDVFIFAASVLLLTVLKLVSIIIKYGLKFSTSNYIICLHKCHSWSQNFHKINLCIPVKQLIPSDNSNIRLWPAKNSREIVVKTIKKLKPYACLGT